MFIILNMHEAEEQREIEEEGPLFSLTFCPERVWQCEPTLHLILSSNSFIHVPLHHVRFWIGPT